MRTTPTLLLSVAAATLVTSMARADDPGYVPPPPEPPGLIDTDARHEIDRTSLYGDDARIPLPMTVVAPRAKKDRGNPASSTCRRVRILE